MQIRAFQESDEPSVVALWKRVFAYSEPRNYPAAVIRQKMAVQRELFFVAVAEEKLVGTVMGGYDGHRGWLYSLAVDESLRRHGIGTRLVAHVENALTERGCPKLNLQVLSAKDDVRAFYEALGYRADAVISLGKRLGELAETPAA